MNRYRIGEFSRRSGISPDTLRYYEKTGVISSVREEENAYRTYSDRDLMEAVQVRFLRSVSAPLAELRQDREPHRLEHIHAQMDREAYALRDEIRTLQSRLERVEMLKRELEECRTGLNRCTRVEYPSVAVLYLPRVMDDASAGLVSAWIACMPYAHISFRIPAEGVDLGENAVMKAQIGFGMLYAYAEKLGVPLHPPAEVTSPVPGVRCVLRVRDPLRPTSRELRPFGEYLARNGLETEGPWHYRLRFIDVNDRGERQYYIAMRVGVKGPPAPH